LSAMHRPESSAGSVSRPTEVGKQLNIPPAERTRIPVCLIFIGVSLLQLGNQLLHSFRSRYDLSAETLNLEICSVSLQLPRDVVQFVSYKNQFTMHGLRVYFHSAIVHFSARDTGKWSTSVWRVTRSQPAIHIKKCHAAMLERAHTSQKYKRLTSGRPPSAGIFLRLA
jgi:hypothetical protein